VFEVFVRDVLVPSLRPRQRVIWDNLSVDRNQTIRSLIEAAGCSLHFLPAFSPVLNPIELAFSKLKALLRRTGARTRAGFDEAISDGLTPTLRCRCFCLDASLRVLPVRSTYMRTAVRGCLKRG
jgi:transposase